MKKRNCPVCSSIEATVIMKFLPELIACLNPAYHLEEYKKVLKGKEGLLTYSKCRNCGMIYCQNAWDNVTLNKIYLDTVDHAKTRNKILTIQKRLLLTRIWMNILRILEISGKEKLEDLKIIDYGCGWGDFLDTVGGFGVRVMGYDIDSEKIKLPKERGHKIACDIEELKSFGPVDLFVMISVLEHLQDPDKILSLAKKLLKPGGLLIFFVMDYRPRYIRKNINRLKNNLPALTKDLDPLEHVNIYDYKRVMATLANYDFDFIATDNVLYLTDFFGIRNNMRLIRLFNRIERLSAKFITWRGTAITVYALNKK